MNNIYMYLYMWKFHTKCLCFNFFICSSSSVTWIVRTLVDLLETDKLPQNGNEVYSYFYVIHAYTAIINNRMFVIKIFVDFFYAICFSISCLNRLILFIVLFASCLCSDYKFDFCISIVFYVFILVLHYCFF